MTEEEFKRTVAEAAGVLNGNVGMQAAADLAKEHGAVFDAPPVAPGVEHVLDRHEHHWRRFGDAADSWYCAFLARGPLTLQMLHEQFGPLRALVVGETLQ